ncbi:dynein axonemal heavy chain 2 [Ischnura elegans]|uniref:dynein axonemal heavy chain 2 n=1 Tax=Ischnura elegans TaxID=197161 RepID=UPI001ED89FB4|nr:dynein axonemal heavy chain 2 [Ischnura elegans]
MEEGSSDEDTEKTQKPKVQFESDNTPEATVIKTDDSRLPKDSVPEEEENTADSNIRHKSPQELNDLIEIIKKYTVLFGLKSDHWRELDMKPVVKFFEDLDEDVLTLFMHKMKLVAKIGLPHVSTDFIFYYLKRKGTEIIPSNFNEEVIFGSIDFSADGWTLKLLQEVYGPYFYQSRHLPPIIKNDICMALHEFLGNLTVIHFQKFGLTVLYLPNDGLEKSVEEAINNVDLIKRWESVAIRWFKQIEKVLKENETGFIESLRNPSDLYTIWLKRLHNLCGIEHQLKLPSVVKIIRALNNAGSSFTEPLITIVPGLVNAIEEAKRNLSFLELLIEPCKGLEYITSPAEIPAKIPNIILALSIIWNCSSYFNQRDQMTPICLSLSNRVLDICSSHVNIDDIAEGKAVRGMTQLQECIEGCLKYQLTYKKLINACNKHGKTFWDVDDRVIFKHCELFMDRCRDVLEICRDMICFARMDETRDIQKPMFGGCQGRKHEKVMNKLEEKYKVILKQTFKHKKLMLDTESMEWNEIMLKYRQEVKHIESAIENLATTIFKKVDCIERGIESLFSFHQFLYKPSMKAFFQRKYAEVLQVFNKEIISTKTELAHRRMKKHPKLPQFAGAAFILNSKMEVLKQEFDMLNGTHWLPRDDMVYLIRENYESLITLVKDRQKEIYEEWYSSIDHNIPMRLNRPIIAVSSTNPGKLVPNFDGYLRRLATEIRYWKMLKFDVPPTLKTFYEKSSTYYLLYNRVYAFTRDYNFLCNVLSDSELVLFKELVLLVDDKINPALTTVTWLTPKLEKFVDECCQHSYYLRDAIKEYKMIHLKIREYCNNIGSVMLVTVKKDHKYSYNELIIEQANHR